MLQMTVDRLRKVKFVDDIFIVTRSDLANKITETIEGIRKENIIIDQMLVYSRITLLITNFN